MDLGSILLIFNISIQIYFFMDNRIRFSLYYTPSLGDKMVGKIIGEALKIDVIAEEKPHQIAQFIHISLGETLGLKSNEIAIIIVNSASAKCIQTKHEKEVFLGKNGTAEYYGFIFNTDDFKEPESEVDTEAIAKKRDRNKAEKTN